MKAPLALPPLATLLRADAAVCTVSGVALILAAAPVAALTGLPAGLVLGAGIALLPSALLMWLVARDAVPVRAGTRVVVAGNAAWVAASLALLASGLVSPTAFGTVFVLVQAAVGGAFGVLEHAALRRLAPA